MSDWIIGVVASLGYIGIGLLTLAENVFPPIPSELIMPLAGFQSVRGDISFWGAVAAGSAGSLAGTCGWYWVGFKIGERRLRAWIERHGRWLALDVEDIDRAKSWFDRHGVGAVFFCRMIPGLRTLISLPAGFNRMPMASFLLPSVLGTLLWTAGLTYVGRLLGANYDQVKEYVGIASWIVIGSIAVIYVWRQVRYLTGRRTSSHRPA
jgi:membrane protein DedA with SNARE-associated domain